MKNIRAMIGITLIACIVVIMSVGYLSYTIGKNRQTAENSEMLNLQTTFVQQYGSESTIRQIVSPDKVYAALWTDSDGIAHVSWNIGGLWVMVYSGNSTSRGNQ